jgi:rhombotail lipoprotein
LAYQVATSRIFVAVSNTSCQCLARRRVIHAGGLELAKEVFSMRIRLVLALSATAWLLSGCEIINKAFCAPNCHSQSQNSSSLVSFLYPDGQQLPLADTIPELRVPLRVGLAFLPSKTNGGAAQLEATQKEQLLERIKQRFSSRRFVSEIVMIPDYYLEANQGFSGLNGVQRLYNIDVMALVSYDQITHQDDNKLSLGYLTIVGAYVLRGTSHDTATLVDLAVVDPATRSLVLRAGGTNTLSDESALVHVERDTRRASAKGFDEATDQMIEHFDAALTKFEADVRAGKANVKVVKRQSSSGPGWGGGAFGGCEIAGLLTLLGWRFTRRPHSRAAAIPRLSGTG